MTAQPQQPVQTCPNCMEFYLRGHLEGQASAEASAYVAARVQRAIELEAEATRNLARAALSAIDTVSARNAPDSTYIPMRREPAPGGAR